MPVVAIEMWRQSGSTHPSFKYFFAATAIAYAFSLVSAVAARHRFPEGWLVPAQPVWDGVYCTSLLYISGGLFSPFVFLYMILIIGSATLFSRKGAYGVAALAAVCYLALCALHFRGLITPLNPFRLALDAVQGVVARVGFHVLAFFAVAALSGYLSEQLRRTGEKLVRAEDRILNLEHLQAAILQSMGSGLMAIDSVGRVMFRNQAAENLLKRAGIAPESHAKVFTRGSGDRNEVRVGEGQGGMVIGYSIFPLADRKGRRIGSILTFQDLTGIRKLEEGLTAADRMAAVGRLAAGLAHEIRNPLASLSGSVQMLKEMAGERTDERDVLFNIVVRETDRLNHLVTDFLGYARPSELRVGEVRIRELVEEVGLFLRQGEGRAGFELAVEIDPEIDVQADREQLEAALLNLFRNSIEASPEGVRVTARGRVEDGFALIEIADDGPGMSETVAPRAFEPFVSDKQGGTGLGLATVHRILQSHGGTVSFENLADGGVVFRLRLPLTSARPSQFGAG